MPKKKLPQSVFDQILSEIDALGPKGHVLEPDEVTVKSFMQRFPHHNDNTARDRLEAAVSRGVMVRMTAVVGGKRCIVYKLAKGAKGHDRSSDSGS